MAKVTTLENKMSELFVDKAPKLPAGGKKFIVNVAPWLTLIAGVLSLLAGLSLWRWAHTVNNGVDYVNSLCNAYAVDAGACADVAESRLNLWVWLAIIVLIVQGVLYLMAFPGLRDRRKKGWDYVFYAALVSVVYSIVSLFTGYNAASNFLGAIIGALISFWLLFQVRSAYTGHQAVKAEPKAPAA